MRLLFVSSFYPPHDRGGMEQLCQEVAVHLRGRGHSVQVLTSQYQACPETSDAYGVLRSLHLQANVHYYRPADFFLKRSAQEQANARALRRAIDQFSPHLIMIWGMWNLSRNLPYWAEQWMPGRVAYYIASTWPIDLDIHEEYWRLPANHPLTEWIWRRLRALTLWQLEREAYPPKLQFEHAMCCSQYIRDTLVESGALPVSASVLYNGIDPEPFWRDLSVDIRPQEGPLRLLYFGTLVPQKGVHTAIKALGLLKQRGLLDHLELTILGSGHPQYEASLRALAARLDVADQVHFVGRVHRDEVPSWLRCFDVFLFTSTGPEAMARTVMEAMAAGLLVIGSEVGGQVEMLVKEENSLTFQPEDAVALANHIERVLNEPALLSRLAYAGQQTILERFTLDRMVDDIETWLTSIVL
jgi:glycosyltransferase involved in cell wall biosynthesis